MVERTDIARSGTLTSTLGQMDAAKAGPRFRRYPGENDRDFRERLAREHILARERERDPSLDGNRRRPVRYEE